MKKRRLDEKLIEDGVVKNKQEAFIIVTEGRVFVDGQKAISPAQPVDPAANIEMKRAREYVGRGAYKLKAALDKFSVSIEGKICADIGTATGGFTEVLLKYGAKKVYAIDTAKGKLDPKLRYDPRVVVMEETDVRDLEHLPEVPEIVSIDVSLISLRSILPAVRKITPGAEVVALFKPQYEARDPSLLHHGIIKSSGVREGLLSDFKNWLSDHEWKIKEIIESPLRGSEGNVEYLIYLISN